MRTVRVLASDPDLLAAVEDSARRRDAREELSLADGNEEQGVAAPALEGILEPLGFRGKVQLPGTRGTHAAALEELRTRLTEQRELRLASERHQRQLSRLRDRSDRLRATTQLSALARLARGIDEYDGWPGDADGVAEPARDEERTG